MPSFPSTDSVEVKYKRGWFVRIMLRHLGLAKAFLRLGYFITTPWKIMSTPMLRDERWKTFGPSLLSVLSRSMLTLVPAIPPAA